MKSPEDNSPHSENEPSQPSKPPRRKRYSGTHPRKFDQRYKELNPDKYPQMQEHIRKQGRTPAGTHVPIMVAEVMQALSPLAGETVADCTLGYGSHAMEFARLIGPTGRLVGFDVDAQQLQRAGERISALGVPVLTHRANFAGIGKFLAVDGIEGYDVIFADLGVSSMQLDDPGRGFSYKNDGPLDMRMDDRLAKSAADLLREMPGEEIAGALMELSDEEDAEAIAELLVRRRAAKPITHTLELSDLVMEAKGIRRTQWRKEAGSSLHPAAKTFQALRILVNDELGSLKQFLRTAPYCLQAGGRIGILTFHSGEDRLVKQSFKDGLAAGLYAEISPDVIRPGSQEIHDNPRSRPAKFRYARKA